MTGTNGKTTTAFLIDAILRRPGARRGPAHEHRAPVGGEPRPTGLNTPEAIDLQRLLREMVDAAATARRARGDLRGPGAGTARRARGSPCSSSPTSPRTTSTSTGRWRPTSQAKAALFAQAERAVVNVGRRVGPAARGEPPRRGRLRRLLRARSRGSSCKLRGALQPRERDRQPRSPPRALGIDRRRRSGAGSSRSPASPGGSRRSRRARRSS